MSSPIQNDYRVSSFVQSQVKDARPSDSFQYLYCLLWRKQVKKWNPPESCFVFRPEEASRWETIVFTYFLFLLHGGRIYYFSLLPEVDNTRGALTIKSPTIFNYVRSVDT